MKLSKIFTVLASASAVLCCTPEEAVQCPVIATEKAAYDLTADAGSVQITFTSNLPWEVVVAPAAAKSDVKDFKAVPASGAASVRPITVTLTYKANPGAKRAALVSILGEGASAAVKLTQAANPDAQEAKGTRSNPFKANDLVAALKAGDIPDGDIFIRGKVSKIKEVDVTQYHNATFWITDDGTHPADDNDAFQAFRVKDYGLSDIENADIVKVGDSVTLLGQVTVYGGKTPETQGNKAQILAVNCMATPKGDGSAQTPYNVGKAMEVIAATGTTATEEVYVRGMVAKIKEISTGYGNATYWITDDGQMTDTEEGALQVFRGKWIGGAAFTDAEQLKLGDEVVLKGTLVSYKGTTPEVNQGNELVTVNGKTE